MEKLCGTVYLLLWRREVHPSAGGYRSVLDYAILLLVTFNSRFNDDPTIELTSLFCKSRVRNEADVRRDNKKRKKRKGTSYRSRQRHAICATFSYNPRNFMVLLPTYTYIFCTNACKVKGAFFLFLDVGSFLRVRVYS